MNRWILMLPVFLLAGCQTITPEERRAADAQTCRDFGFRKKNDAFAACMQRIELDRSAQRRANAIALSEFRRDDWFYRRPVVVYHVHGRRR